jgi:hypothetical protein
MEFENDIFISYAHLDNRLVDEDKQEGWIDEFHRCLEIRVAEYSGEPPKIWRDPKIQGNDYFDEKIIENIPKTAILISVFSPRYIKSSWCLRELEEFCKSADEGRLKNKSSSRIFKVIKLPFDRQEILPKIQKLLGYRFHTNPPPAPPRQLTLQISEFKESYYKVLDDLASQISETLRILKTSNSDTEDQDTIKNTASIEKTIYLAKTTQDLRDDRAKLWRELKQREYTVLPDEELPDCSPDFELAVQDCLQRSCLSIHLIGERYGAIPEAEKNELSVIELQYNLAVAYQQNSPGFSHIVWLPENLIPQEEKQKALIEMVQNDSEYLQTSLEELKTVVQDKLKPKNLNVIRATGALQIYLMIVPEDMEDINPLYDYLMDRPEFEVILPTFEGNETDVRQAHQDNLRDCDIFWLYYGKGNSAWLQGKLRDCIKAPGWGREKPILSKVVYVADPPSKEKEIFRTNQALLIKDFAEFSPELLSTFFDEVQKKLGGLP